MHFIVGYPTHTCILITAKDILQNPPKCDATAKGRLVQSPRGLQSRKPALIEKDATADIREPDRRESLNMHRDNAKNIDEALNHINDLGAARAKIPGLKSETYSDDLALTIRGTDNPLHTTTQCRF
jgi:hypothetical protein